MAAVEIRVAGHRGLASWLLLEGGEEGPHICSWSLWKPEPSLLPGPSGGCPANLLAHTLSSLTSALALTQLASCNHGGPEFWLLCMASAISASVMGTCTEPSKWES